MINTVVLYHVTADPDTGAWLTTPHMAQEMTTEEFAVKMSDRRVELDIFDLVKDERGTTTYAIEIIPAW